MRSIVANSSLEIRALVLLSALLGLMVFANAWGVFTPDTKPEIFAHPAQSAYRYAQAWIDSPGLGAANYNTGVAPVAALFAALDWLGVPAWVTVRLWRLGLLLIALWGARFAVRELARSGSAVIAGRGLAVAGVAAGVAYVANPYAIVGGGTTPTMQPYAFLPWLLVFWLRAFRAHSRMSAAVYAALAALALAAMGGLNAGVVPVLQLVIVIPLTLHALIVERIPVLRLLGVLAGTAVAYLLMSLYWLVPALGALGAATAVADGTESLEAINLANSFPEVLRGLGMWSLYGGDGSGSFNPNHQSYLTSPIVIALSFGGPVLAAVGVLMSRSVARLFGAASVLLAALFMVGTFNIGSMTRWGTALEWAVETVPGVVAFRTTNKVGAVLELGLAVLVGLAAAALLPILEEGWQKVAALMVGGAVVAAGIAPALAGGLFPIQMDLPAYWEQAGAVIDGPDRGEGRVLVVPGSGAPHYDWGYRGPDEIGPTVFTRPSTLRTVHSVGSSYTGALLGETDRQLRLGILPPGTVSTLATYLGAGDVVGRHGLRGTGVTAGSIEEQLDADPGLGDAEIFKDNPDDVSFASARRVRGRGLEPPVRATQGPGLVIDGSGASLPDLQSAGVLEGAPTLLFSGSMTTEDLASSISDRAKLVITDGNRRRDWSPTNGTAVGPVLSPNEPLGWTHTLFDERAQTTAATNGNATLESYPQDPPFGLYAYGGAEQAFDGDTSTAWRFGHFRSGASSGLIIRPNVPLPMPTVTLQPMQRSEAWIEEARVTAHFADHAETQDVTFSQWNSLAETVEFGEGDVESLTIDVTKVGGDGGAPVGFTSIDVPGVEVRRTLVLPTNLSGRLAEAAELAGVSPADVPLDIVLARASGLADGRTAEEALLSRDFDLPVAGNFDVQGLVRLGQGVPDWWIDRIFGSGDAVTADASSRRDDSPMSRASMAVDGDPRTAWRPNDPVVGEWITVDFPEQELTSFSLTQGTGSGVATQVLVSLDDGIPFEATLQPGTTRIALPQEATVSRVRILITQWSGSGVVEFFRLGLPRVSRSVETSSCVTAGWLNDTPLTVAIGDRENREALLRGEAVPFHACGGPIALSPGAQEVRGEPGLALDLLHLSMLGAATTPAGPAELEVLSYQSHEMTIRLGEDCGPCWVSSGQAFDARWTAAADGADLGRPLVVDGYAAGWRVDAPAGTTVTMRYAPQGTAIMAWVISAVTAVALVVFVVLRGRAAWSRARLRRPGVVDSALVRSPDGAGPRIRPATSTIAVVGTLASIPAAWWTVGPLASGIIIVLFVLRWFVVPKRQIFQPAAVIAMAGVPVGWFAGSTLPLLPAAVRIGDNPTAHVIGGLAVWLLFLAALWGVCGHDHRQSIPA